MAGVSIQPRLWARFFNSFFFKPTMVYKKEDLAFIKGLNEAHPTWGARKILKEFPHLLKRCRRAGIQNVLDKIRATCSIERRRGSGRKKAAELQKKSKKLPN